MTVGPTALSPAGGHAAQPDTAISDEPGGSRELSSNQVIEEIAWMGACWHRVSGS
jgi:hypothetical protein